MSENKITPTTRPWSAVKIHAVEVAGWWNIQDGPNYEDTDILDEERCPEAAANAAHIVNCVNTYEEREALLTEMAEFIESVKALNSPNKYARAVSLIEKYKSHTS